MSAWRELSDSELFELSQTCEHRLEALAAQGVVLQGADMHYLTTMIEQLLGERATDSAREKHLLWMRDRLDEVEPQIRQARILGGVAPAPGPAPNGRYTPPKAHA
jgi:hypothetical protein